MRLGRRSRLRSRSARRRRHPSSQRLPPSPAVARPGHRPFSVLAALPPLPVLSLAALPPPPVLRLRPPSRRPFSGHGGPLAVAASRESGALIHMAGQVEILDGNGPHGGRFRPRSREPGTGNRGDGEPGTGETGNREPGRRGTGNRETGRRGTGNRETGRRGTGERGDGAKGRWGDGGWERETGVREAALAPVLTWAGRLAGRAPATRDPSAAPTPGTASLGPRPHDGRGGEEVQP